MIYSKSNRLKDLLCPIQTALHNLPLGYFVLLEHMNLKLQLP